MSTKLQEKLRCQKRGEEFVDETLSSIGRTPESQHYVKNSVLLAEILKCKRENNGQASDELAKMFNDNFSSKYPNMPAEIVNAGPKAKASV